MEVITVLSQHLKITTLSYPAVDYGLNLTVELVNDPFYLDEDTQVSIGQTESKTRRRRGAEEEDETEDPAYVVGNITFVTLTSLGSEEDEDGEDATYYYQYEIQGPSLEQISNSRPNLTRGFMEVGAYQYTIHAFAKLSDIQAHHANVSGSFWVLGESVKRCVWGV